MVLPDRDSAEAVAELCSELPAGESAPEVHREALAGEDDAEDAQWLVVLDGCSDDDLDLTALAELAETHGGWLERD
nr:hypothetical protein [Streptomyces spiramenti]